ncbi:beta-glucosidase like protein [Verticillium longisporum]|uniref:Beta-glucosidase like protein n=1 Tax=Verticillium longisporum TaxID=100787 RepID=A0A8I2Z4X4_VERLO|nr:beta-glucosidase like protein [Verticillium longisporum]KAG7119556.1 beta-glucosidase like protein [Verticillium longisporum]KAG7149323.1 beta-glucosidase like protein [Verticillium longisporum]
MQDAPIFNSGFGLFYADFDYSDIKVARTNRNRLYSPRTGNTMAAPNLAGNFTRNPADYPFPSNEFEHIPLFIYTYLSGLLPPNAFETSAQPVLPSSGEPGGNPQLYDVMYTLTATIRNTGDIVGNEVPQL